MLWVCQWGCCDAKPLKVLSLGTTFMECVGIVCGQGLTSLNWCKLELKKTSIREVWMTGHISNWRGWILKVLIIATFKIHRNVRRSNWVVHALVQEIYNKWNLKTSIREIWMADHISNWRGWSLKVLLITTFKIYRNVRRSNWVVHALDKEIYIKLNIFSKLHLVTDIYLNIFRWIL